MRRSAAPVLAALSLVVCGGAQAAVPLVGPTAVRVWHDVALLSVQQGKAYRLATQTGLEAPRVLPGIAPSAGEFDADIGPGPDGAPVIVFVRCSSRLHCKLMRTTERGIAEVSIAGPASRNGVEHAPAVWRNRLLFAGSFANGSEHLYERPLEGSATTPSVALPTPARAEIRSLSLRGSLVAETLDLGTPPEGEGCDSTAVRLLDIATRRGRLLSSTGCGLGVENLLGASVTAGHVLWALTCLGDSNGCTGKFRGRYGNQTVVSSYGLRDHRIEHVVQKDELLGFAADDEANAVEITAPEGEEGNCYTLAGSPKAPPCELERLGPIPFGPPTNRPPVVAGS